MSDFETLSMEKVFYKESFNEEIYWKCSPKTTSRLRFSFGE